MHHMRRHIRFPTDLEATLHHAGQTHEIRVRDISELGMMIEGAMLPLVGQWVQVNAEDLDVGGRLIWRKDRKAGLKLDAFIRPLAVIRSNHPRFRDMRRNPAETG